MRKLGPRFRERLTDGASMSLTYGEYQRYWGGGNSQGIPAGHPYDGDPTIIVSPSVPVNGKYERCWDILNPGPPYLSGGSFTKASAFFPTSEIQGLGVYNGRQSDWIYYQYRGGWAMPDYQFFDELDLGDYAEIGLNRVDNPLFPDLNALGSEAYAKLRPKVELAGVGVALAEARDLPRMMKTSAKGFHEIWRTMGGKSSPLSMAPKKVADNFLNHQFGWAPFLKDLSDVHNVLENSSKLMRQLARDNGKWVKRVRTNDIIESETTTPWTNGFNCLPANIPGVWQFNVEPQYRYILRNITSVWYEGVFKYFRPEFDMDDSKPRTALGDLHRLSTMLGARINPSVVWKATPWTWLIDWFSNVGDSIQRVNDWAFDGVVSKYMYLMHHTKRVVLLEQRLPLYDGTQTLTWSRRIEIKRRENANSPYGFQLSPDSLSPRQLAILGSLGISRSY